MQHVERSKCVFISSRLIYSPLAWRWERRTTIYNELDVSDHTVFAVQSFLLLHWDCFCYFFGLYVCVFVHPVSSKSLCGAVLGWLNTKNGMEAWNCRWALWGPWHDRVQMHYPLHKASTSDKDGEKKMFFCVLRRKWTSKKPLVQCICFFFSLIMRALGFVLRCLSSVDWLNAPAERGNVNEEDRSLCLHFSFMKRPLQTWCASWEGSLSLCMFVTAKRGRKYLWGTQTFINKEECF